MSGDRVDLKFGADTSGLDAGAGHAKQEVEAFAATVDAAKEQMVEFGTAIIEAFAVEKVAEFARETAELGRQIYELSQRTAVATETLSALNLAAKEHGETFESVERTFERLGMSMEKAIATAGPQRAAFDALGISTKFLHDNQQNLQAVLEKVMDAYHGHADGAAKSAINQEIFGRGAAVLIPVFNEGSKALGDLRDRANELGIAFDDANAKAFTESAQKMDELHAAWQGLSVTAFGELRPAIDGLVQGLTGLIVAFTNSAKEGGALHLVFEGIKVDLFWLSSAIDVADKAFFTLGASVDKNMKDIAIEVRSSVEIASDYLTGDWTEATKAAERANAELAENTRQHAVEIEGYWGKLTGDMKTMWEGLFPQEQKPQAPKQPALNLNLGNDNAARREAEQRFAIEQKTALALAEIDINAAQYAADEKIQIAANNASHDLQLGILTQKQFLELEQQSHQAEIANAEDALRQKMALLEEKAAYAETYGTNSKLFEQANASITTQIKQLELELDKLKDKAAVDFAKIGSDIDVQVQKPLTDLIDSLTQGFQSGLQGMLQFTTTWAGLVRNLYNGLTQWLAKLITDEVKHWIAGEVLKTQATQAGAEARVVAQEAATGQGLIGMAEAAIKWILNEALQVFAGVFAFLSPEMGPYAAAPAGASMAAVAAMAGSVLSARGGFEVDRDQVMKVHEKEVVLPAEWAERLKMVTGVGGGGGSGGGDAHLHVHALDGRSVERLFKNNGRAMRDTLIDMKRMGAFIQKPVQLR